MTNHIFLCASTILAKIERTSQHHDSHERETHEDFVADHLSCRPQSRPASEYLLSDDQPASTTL